MGDSKQEKHAINLKTVIISAQLKPMGMYMSIFAGPSFWISGYQDDKKTEEALPLFCYTSVFSLVFLSVVPTALL